MKKILFLNVPITFETRLKEELQKVNNVYAAFVKFHDLVITPELDVVYKDTSVQQYDLVFLGLMSKSLEVSIFLDQYLRQHKIKFIKYGGERSIYNKLNEYNVLSQSNLPVIKSYFFDIRNKSDTVQLFNLEFPFVIKPVFGSKGEGVLKINSVEDFKSKVSMVNNVQNSTEKYLYIAQPFIKNNGDYRVFIVGKRVIASMKRESQQADEFRSNISQGGIGTGVSLPSEYLEIAIEAAEKMNVEIAGVDLILDQDSNSIKILEINQAPQFTGIEKYTGKNAVGEILKYILEKV